MKYEGFADKLETFLRDTVQEHFHFDYEVDNDYLVIKLQVSPEVVPEEQEEE